MRVQRQQSTRVLVSPVRLINSSDEELFQTETSINTALCTSKTTYTKYRHGKKAPSCDGAHGGVAKARGSNNAGEARPSCHKAERHLTQCSADDVETRPRPGSSRAADLEAERLPTQRHPRERANYVKIRISYGACDHQKLRADVSDSGGEEEGQQRVLRHAQKGNRDHDDIKPTDMGLGADRQAWTWNTKHGGCTQKRDMQCSIPNVETEIHDGLGRGGCES